MAEGKFDVDAQFSDRQHVSDDFLLREAAHRYKNLLSVVRAIATQTGRNYTEEGEFKAELDKRLAALSHSHDLLVATAGGVRLNTLVRGQLNVVIGPDDLGLFTINGPEVKLQPTCTQSLGIALYELATNSLKHGALSRREGSVHINWNASNHKDSFAFVWQENGSHGNDITKKGFGHLVLETIVPESLKGTADLFVSSVGVSWILKCPLSMVEQEAGMTAVDALLKT